MNITITSHGTRGDVQPYLTLAVGLQKAGHRVTLATSYNYTDWIQSYGVQTHPTQYSVQEWMKKPEIQALMGGRNFLKQMQSFMGFMKEEGPKAMDEVWAAIQNADFVIQSPASGGAIEAAQTLGLPVAMAYPGPFAPTREYPSVFIGRPRFSLGGGYNRMTHTFMHSMLWGSMSGPMAKALSKKLNQPAMRSFAQQAEYMRQKGIPELNGFSEHVLPRPADWDENQHIAGYWFLEPLSDWQPSPKLIRFLESGPPPVYIGFGSMAVGKPEEKTRLILKALELSGQRGVVLTGWGGLTRLSNTALPSNAPAPVGLPNPAEAGIWQSPLSDENQTNIFFVDNVPHGWLFPRMSALVHHGGAGTTGEGVRAGVPNIITPLGADQFFWAERMVKLGVGPKAPVFRDLTAETLAQAIQAAVHDPAMRARAAALGEKIRAEDGVARAVEIIERCANDFQRKKV